MLVALKHPFVAAHVDHGWREESGSEAHLLQERAKECGVPFYSTKLQGDGKGRGNLEEVGRLARYEYFEKLSKKLGINTLCLAHHQDDQSETTLSRFLQGYTL